jgi:pyruvate,water dikinase
MYYNMNNWYRMAEFVPGYRRNKQNFELMITSNIKAEVTTAIRPSTMLTVGYPFIVAAKVAMYGLTAAHFKSSVKKHLQYLRTHDFGTLDYSECVDLFEELNRKLLRRWYVTLENDFFVMTYLGILKKMLPEEKMQRALIFPSKATEQVTALAALSLTMRKEKDLWQAVESTDIARFERELGRYPKINQMLSEYLHTFGGRFANELKLESRGVDEDPSKLLAVLKIYQDYVPRASPISFETELSPFRKIIFKLVLHKFKKYASRREEFRLLRSNTFAMARKLFRRMGSILQSEGLIEGADDVFYLHLSEILEKGSKSHLRTIVHRRKEEYDSFKSITPPSHFSTINKAPPSAKKVSISGTNMIQGRPASPGRIKGEVRVFKDFSMPLKVDFDILVTSHTDPGWTSLIALSKGLIIEHGGVLSHASIVARELGIPAVIGASDAVTLLRDHLIVEIDGSSGMITILDHAN